jgi:hypothetical protein
MHLMEIDRRRWLAGALAVASSGVLPARAAPAQSEALYAATRKGAGGAYSAAIFNAAGRDLNAVTLAARGHDVTVCPVSKRCVAFARRPGNFAVAFATDRAAPPLRFTTPPDRHFYGHGIFSPDGRLLFATENDFGAGEGRIGIYDASGGFQRQGEFSAHGIDPHDIALLRDGATLVIANGGMATHPDFGEGRVALNLADMQPSLTYIDLRNGDLIEKHVLPRALHTASLRHLDIGAGDRVIIGCQTPPADENDLPLILRHRRGRALSIVEIGRGRAAAMRGYVSSVAVDGSGEIAALTSSKGGLALFIEVATGRIIGSRALTDVSGVAPDARSGAFLLTSGYGEIVAGVSPETVSGLAETAWHWDNHAVKL